MPKIETISLPLNALQSSLVYIALSFFMSRTEAQIDNPDNTKDQNEQFKRVVCLTEDVLDSLGKLIDAAADAEAGVTHQQAAYMVN